MSAAPPTSPGMPADMPTIQVAGGWETLLEGAARQALERSVLPAFIAPQRWFGGKARRLEGIRVVDWGQVPAGDCLAFLTLCATDFADGSSDLYCLSLGVTSGPAAVRLVEALRPWVVARLTGPAGGAVFNHAPAENEVCTALLAASRAGSQLPAPSGHGPFVPTRASLRLRGDSAGGP